MSKAVLVIEMPENCIKCKLQDWATCRITKRCHTGNERPEHCPLKQLPEKQKLTFAMHGEDMIAMGWNAAVEAIESEE